MKKIISALLVMNSICFSVFPQTGSVGIGTTNPNSSAALDIQSTSKGILIPRMTSVQRNTISSPAAGLLVFDNTTGSFWFSSNGAWVELIDTLNSVWKKNGNNIYAGESGNIGIGTSSPAYNLHLNRTNAALGFTDADDSTFSGSITADSTDLVMISARAIIGGTPGNLLLQTNSGLAVGGNVGIGLNDPFQKLAVNGSMGLYAGNNVLGTFTNSSGDLLVNAKSGSLLNGTIPQDIILQHHTGLGTASGKVGIGTDDPAEKLDVSGNVRITGELNRESSGTANMVPAAYGRVNSNGLIGGGTGNFSIVSGSSSPYPRYIITVPSLPASAEAIIIVTPGALYDPVFGIPNFQMIVPHAGKKSAGSQFAQFEVFFWTWSPLAFEIVPWDFSFVVYAL